MAESRFLSQRPAWLLGQMMKGKSVKFIAQALAIVACSASRANGVDNAESLGKLTHKFEQLIAPFNVGGVE